MNKYLHISNLLFHYTIPSLYVSTPSPSHPSLFQLQSAPTLIDTLEHTTNNFSDIIKSQHNPIILTGDWTNATFWTRSQPVINRLRLQSPPMISLAPNLGISSRQRPKMSSRILALPSHSHTTHQYSRMGLTYAPHTVHTYVHENHNTLGCKQPPGRGVNLSLEAHDVFYHVQCT